MAGEQATTAKAASKDARQRSTIGFPYMALESAVELADAIHSNVGRGVCEDDQLAAWTNQSAKSSGFRVQVYAGRMFGILEGDARSHSLTQLGLAIVDPNQAREAKARAFLAVPLFKAVYEAFKGGVLPPAAALERELVRMGVSEKQKDRARQVLEKSADQAGFYEHGRNRLIMPGIAAAVSTAQPTEKNDGDNAAAADRLGGGSDGGGLDPVIAALIKKLPKGQSEWPVDQRVTWLQMIAMAFDMAYKPGERIEIKKAVS